MRGKSRSCLVISTASEKKRSKHPARVRNLVFVHHVSQAPKVAEFKLAAVRHRLPLATAPRPNFITTAEPWPCLAVSISDFSA